MHEVEGDPEAVMAKVQEAVASGVMVMSDTLNRETVGMAFWSPRGRQVQS